MRIDEQRIDEQAADGVAPGSHRPGDLGTATAIARRLILRSGRVRWRVHVHAGAATLCDTDPGTDLEEQRAAVATAAAVPGVDTVRALRRDTCPYHRVALAD